MGNAAAGQSEGLPELGPVHFPQIQTLPIFCCAPQEGRHFSCERETIMEMQVHFQLIFSRATENGPAFRECLVCTNKYTAQYRPSAQFSRRTAMSKWRRRPS